MKVSIVVPSFNQGAFLRRCLDSISFQTHKNNEVFIYDPGSIDDSLGIYKNYPGFNLRYKSDRGQSNAINKGFLEAGGDILCWLNSDDFYLDENVLSSIVIQFARDDSLDILCGQGRYFNNKRAFLRSVYVHSDFCLLNDSFRSGCGVCQPATFIRRRVFDEIGLLNERLSYSMDYEYWIRCAKAGKKFVRFERELAGVVIHDQSKTHGQRDKSYREVFQMLHTQFGYVSKDWTDRYADYKLRANDGVLTFTAKSELCADEELGSLSRRVYIYYQRTNLGRDSREEFSNLGDSDPSKFSEFAVSSRGRWFGTEGSVADDPAYTSYMVGGKRKWFSADWRRVQQARTIEFIERLKANRRSDVCIILGNGPSLNKTPAKDLEQFFVIGSNNIFLSPDYCRIVDIYTVVNYLVAEESGLDINLIQGLVKIVPYWLSDEVLPFNDVYYLEAQGKPEFFTDYKKNISWRHTVTFFNLHIAYALGFKTVLLVGFDHFYSQPPGTKEGESIQSDDEDMNHFHPDYFKGKKWQAADVNSMEEMYKLAKDAYEKDGRQIINCTVGGHLNLFARARLDDYM